MYLLNQFMGDDMRNIAIGISLGLIATLGHAQTEAPAKGYVGAVLALSSISIDCAGSCDKKSLGYKFYVGSQFEEKNQLDLGFAKVQGVEVGYLKFGKASSGGAPVSYTTVDTDGNASTVLRSSSKTTAVSALTLALVTRAPIVPEASAVLRTGLAYVAATAKNYKESVAGGQMLSVGSVTETHFRPYLGLGFEYSVMRDLRVVGSYDLTKFQVDGRKSTTSLFGIGAEMSY